MAMTTTVIMTLDSERAKWNACNADVKSADERLRKLLLTNSIYKTTAEYEAELPEYYGLFQKMNNGHNNRLRLLDQWIADMERDKENIVRLRDSGMNREREVQDLEKRVQNFRVLEQEARDFFAKEYKWRDDKHVDLRARNSDFASNSSYRGRPEQMKEYCKNLTKWDEDVIKELKQLQVKRIEKPMPVSNFARPGPVVAPPPPPPQNYQNQNYNNPPPPPPPPPPQNNNRNDNGLVINGQDINPGCCYIL